MSFQFGKTRVRIHPLLPCVLVLAAVSGTVKAVLPFLFALTLHECGHLILTRILHVQLDSVELTPLGGMMTMNDSEVGKPARVMISLAGPILSLAGYGFFVWLLYQSGQNLFLLECARANLLLGLINLLPALPLDGGQALLCLFSGSGPARKILSAAGFALGLGMFSLSLIAAFQGVLLLSPTLAGCCLCYAASVERRDAASRCIHAFIGRRHKLENGDMLPIEYLAANPATPVCRIALRSSERKFLIVRVLDQNSEHVTGSLDENELCSALLENASVSLGDALRGRKTD